MMNPVIAVAAILAFASVVGDEKHPIEAPETQRVLRHVYRDGRPMIQWITDADAQFYVDRISFGDPDEGGITAVATEEHIELQVSDHIIGTNEAVIKGRYSRVKVHAAKMSYTPRPDPFREKYLHELVPHLDARSWHKAAPTTLKSLRGKAVLIDFWGVWCPPCVYYLRHNQKLYDEFAKDGLEIVAVHSARDGEKMKEFLDQRQYTFKFCVDTGKTAKAYMVEGWPTYLLLDRSGRLVWGPNHSPPTRKEIEFVFSQDANTDKVKPHEPK